MCLVVGQPAAEWDSMLSIISSHMPWTGFTQVGMPVVKLMDLDHKEGVDLKTFARAVEGRLTIVPLTTSNMNNSSLASWLGSNMQLGVPTFFIVDSSVATLDKNGCDVYTPTRAIDQTPVTMYAAVVPKRGHQRCVPIGPVQIPFSQEIPGIKTDEVPHPKDFGQIPQSDVEMANVLVVKGVCQMDPGKAIGKSRILYCICESNLPFDDKGTFWDGMTLREMIGHWRRVFKQAYKMKIGTLEDNGTLCHSVGGLLTPISNLTFTIKEGESTKVIASARIGVGYPYMGKLIAAIITEAQMEGRSWQIYAQGAQAYLHQHLGEADAPAERNEPDLDL
jgi:hypothetical protein